ncbi:MAG: glycosyltransferase family 4 protein [Chitinophagaceae bacterium]|nr:glycosyltransferase family 4 protein [Chitinophagaceae bacterium]
MTFLYLALIIISLFMIELLYFRLADRFNIIDKPNERSSHTIVTIRGGGILFPFAWLIYFIVSGGAYPYFTIGLMLVSVVSFWDDITPLSSRIRLMAHLLAFTASFMELDLFTHVPLWYMPIIYIVCIGCLNVINFMDGINGMTGLYSLSVLVPLGIWIMKDTYFQQPILYLVCALIVFGWFNFRKKARCFAGDIGSVSIGFIMIFLILAAMFNRKPSTLNSSELNFHFSYILLLALYGVDGILTMIQRLFNRENIFKPHRKHLYQYLANEMRWPHLWVAILYASIQTLMNIALLKSLLFGWQAIILLTALIFFYILVKWRLHIKIFNTAKSLPE